MSKIPKNNKMGSDRLWTPGFVGMDYTVSTPTLQGIGDPRTGFPVPVEDLVRDETGAVTSYQFQDKAGFRQRKHPVVAAQPLQSHWWQRMLQKNRKFN